MSTVKATSLALSFLLVMAMSWACAERAPEGTQDLGDRRTPALVAMSMEHHKLADLALASGDRNEAKRQMMVLLDEGERHKVRTPEGYDVTFDAATRLARMELEDKDLKSAELAARRGLKDEEQAPATLFRGYLHQVLGDILEERGDLKGAVDQHGEAIEIFKAILEADAPAEPEGDTP